MVAGEQCFLSLLGAARVVLFLLGPKTVGLGGQIGFIFGISKQVRHCGSEALHACGLIALAGQNAGDLL